MKLSLLTILLGVGMGLPQVYGLVQPARLASAARKFPRNLPAGIFLMLLGTAWFLWNVNSEPIADFSVFKPYMMAAFAAVGILSCIFIQDFLAVRGLAVVLLLLGRLMLDTGRPHLGESPWVPAFQAWAYVFIILGMWFTVTPWKLRDILDWATASAARVRILCLIRLGFAAGVVDIGVTAFRANGF